jgi:hypothetical protein
MATYRVNAQVTISVSTLVEADSSRAAIEIAESRSMPSLCFACGGTEDSEREEWSLGGDLDGEPTELFAEEIK